MTRVTPEEEYLAMQPRFSKDFTKLVYVAREEKFISHSGCYQLKLLSWPVVKGESKIICDIEKDYPKDD